MAAVLYVHVRPAQDEVYGGERSTVISAEALRGAGVEVRFLVTADDAFAEYLRARQLDVVVVPEGDPVAGLRGSGRLEQAVKLESLARINFAVARQALSMGSCMVHASGLPSLLGCVLGARLTANPCIYHIRDLPMGRRTRWLDAAAILMSDKTVAITESLAAALLSTAPPSVEPALRKRLKVVHNGIDFAEIESFIARSVPSGCVAETFGPKGSFRALLVGSIEARKGQLRLLERVIKPASERVPGLQVAFVGGVKEPDYMQDCQEAVRRLGLEGVVRFCGYLPIRDVYPWYRAADVVLVGSEREGLNRSAVEALAFGHPVLTTAIPGPIDVVDHGVTGYHVPEDDLEEMGEHLVRLANDPDLKRRLGTPGPEIARQRFGVSAHLQAIQQTYSDLDSAWPIDRTRRTR